MNEERQTRLLPFRLRRKGARGDATPGDRQGDSTADAELRSLLRAWEAPRPSPGSRTRLIEAFRAEALGRGPLWRRLMSARVSVPLPLAACLAAAVLLSAFALAGRVGEKASRGAAGAPAPEPKVVEVPVPRDRVVTRVVYVEKEPRRAGARPAAPRRAKAGGPKSDAETSYFTRVDMAEFQPAEEMKIRVIKKGKTDED